MREIKFRAWVTSGLGLIEEYFMSYNITDINFAQGGAENSNIKKGCPVKLRINNDPTKAFGMHLDSKEPVVLMQYTGLTDSQGVEIYEGDIVETNAIDGRCLWEVLWMELDILTGFSFEPIGHTFSSIHNSVDTKGKVVGNIH